MLYLEVHLDFWIPKAVQRGEARGGVMAPSEQSADIERPCQPLVLRHPWRGTALP